jgi:hypothetical protein
MDGHDGDGPIKQRMFKSDRGWKAVQRRLLSALATRSGLGIFCVTITLCLASLAFSVWSFSVQNTLPFHEFVRTPAGAALVIDTPCSASADNIAGKPFHSLCYPPVDIVYTWVNGSDPVWLSKKDFWKNKLLPPPPTNWSALPPCCRELNNGVTPSVPSPGPMPPVMQKMPAHGPVPAVPIPVPVVANASFCNCTLPYSNVDNAKSASANR